MKTVPSSINTKFKSLLHKKRVPAKDLANYLKWLRYYLDFCHKYGFDQFKPQSLPHFIKKLNEKRQPQAQQKQAREAIRIYYNLIQSEPDNSVEVQIEQSISAAAIKESRNSCA